jgi:hypothetical protein
VVLCFLNIAYHHENDSSSSPFQRYQKSIYRIGA